MASWANVWARVAAVSVALLLISSCEVPDPAPSDLVADDWGAGLAPHETDVAYGDDLGCGPGSDEACGGSTELDIYLPTAGGSIGTILWLHGGGFRSGDKADLDFFGQIKRQTHRGFGVVSANYRMPTTDDSAEMGLETTIADVVAALDWLRASGATHGLNTSAIIVAGHSAGGTLAALVGTTANSPEPVFAGMTQVDGWLSVSGILDWNAGVMSDFWGQRWLGAGFRSTAQLAAPTSHFDAGDPPGYLIHGSEDTFVDLSNATRFHDVVKSGSPSWARVAVDVVDVTANGERLNGETGHSPMGGANSTALDFWLDARAADGYEHHMAGPRHFGARSTALKVLG